MTLRTGVAVSHFFPPSLETSTVTEVPLGMSANRPASFNDETALVMVVVAPCTVAEVPLGVRSSERTPSPPSWNCRAYPLQYDTWKHAHMTFPSSYSARP